MTQTTTTIPERNLRFDACLNVRDLGGLPLIGGGRTRYGSLVRADGLFRLTEEGMRDLAAHGITTVLDLRFPDELQRRPNPFEARTDLGVKLVHVSLMDVSNDAILAVDRAHLPWLQWNIEMLRLAGPQMAEIFSVLALSGPGISLFHCHAGKDRTGLVAVLVEALAGVEDQAIAADYVATNDNLVDTYAQIIAQYEEGSAERLRLETEMPCKPETALATLAFVRATHGGVAEYMKSIGLSDNTIAALRARLA